MNQFDGAHFRSLNSNYWHSLCLKHASFVGSGCWLRAAITLFILIVSQSAMSQEIVISTWGGSYEYAQRKAIFDPFEKLTGIKISTQLQAGGLAMLDSEQIPDLVDMEEKSAQLACQQKLLLALDFKEVLAEPSRPTQVNINVAVLPDNDVANGNVGEAQQQSQVNEPRDLETDFIRRSFLPCGVAHLTFSTLIAYRPNAFPGKKPQTIEDFFDLKNFPGKRGLRKSPGTILEWALMAGGVPISQVYDLLSTDRGLKLAFKRLDTIREQIIWWEGPEETAKLLANQAVVMTSGFNGRFFEAQSSSNPLIMLWDGQIIDRSIWVVPASHKVLRPEVRQFIRFATQSAQMAKLAEYIPYGPTRHSALERIGNHYEKGEPMQGHLPTAEHHLDRALVRDTNWYASTEKLRQEAFEEWLAQGADSILMPTTAAPK